MIVSWRISRFLVTLELRWQPGMSSPQVDGFKIVFDLKSIHLVLLFFKTEVASLSIISFTMADNTAFCYIFFLLTSTLIWTLTSSCEQILFDKSRVAVSACVSDDNIVSFYEGVKLPEMERSRISNWSWCHFPNGAAGVPCPLDRVGHHDRDRRLSPLMTSTLASRAASLDLPSFALLPYFPPPVFLSPFDCFWHEASGWAENMWENITRVFTGAEKAGQTNHLSLYCSTFPSQTLQTFQGRMLQNDRMHLRKPLFGK